MDPKALGEESDQQSRKGDSLKITNCGRGPHQREVKGIERLQRELASSWYAYTNLELATSPGEGRERGCPEFC